MQKFFLFMLGLAFLLSGCSSPTPFDNKTQSGDLLQEASRQEENERLSANCLSQYEYKRQEFEKAEEGIDAVGTVLDIFYNPRTNSCNLGYKYRSEGVRLTYRIINLLEESELYSETCGGIDDEGNLYDCAEDNPEMLERYQQKLQELKGNNNAPDDSSQEDIEDQENTQVQQGNGEDDDRIQINKILKEGEPCGENLGKCAEGLFCHYPCGIQGCQHVCAPEGTLSKPQAKPQQQ